MTNKQVKICSTSLIIREMQVRTQWDTTSYLSEWLSSNRQVTASVGEDEKREPLSTGGWNICETITENSMTVLQKIELPCTNVCSVASVMSNSATPWTIAHQAPLPMGFLRQKYWSGLPFPPPGDLPDPGIDSPSPALTTGFFTTEPPGKPIAFFVTKYSFLGDWINMWPYIWRAAYTSQLQQKRKAICAHFKRGIEHKLQCHSSSFLPTCQPCHLERTELTPGELPLLTKHLETMLAPWYPFFPECQDTIQRQEKGQVVLKCAHCHSWHTSSIPIYLKECIHFLEILHNKSINQIHATFPFLLPLIAYALRAINQGVWSVTGSPSRVFKLQRDDVPGLEFWQGMHDTLWSAFYLSD